MYAKLVFQSGTPFTDVNRDIVRCITNSDGAGGSTVGALEFVDASQSVIDDTVASNWSLAAGQTIATGAFVEQDKQFYLQQTHANTSTKTVAMRTVYKDTTGSTQANNTTYGGVMLCPVSDYGESYEAIWHSVAENTTPSVNNVIWSRITGEVVHIIARDKLIMIAGSRFGYYGGTSYCGIMEVDGSETRVGRNRPAQCVITGASSTVLDYDGGDQASTKDDILDITTLGPFTADHMLPAILAFVDALYDDEAGTEVRYSHMTIQNAFDDNMGIPTGTSWTGYACYATRNTGNSDGIGTFLSYIDNSSYAQQLWETSGAYWGYGQNSMGWWPASNSNRQHSGTSFKDVDGNNSVLLRPVFPIVGRRKHAWDLSTDGGYYLATPNFAGNFANINDGVNDYIAIKIYSAEESSVGVAFRK